MPTPLPKIIFCPRCDRPYEGATYKLALDVAKKHVAEQHPNHDPNWHDTYPHELGEN